ncbi:CRE-GNRR-5 protein [Aphelenchoides avenae]|nr:CRE-GNRR-5 protein [Aphelenchus avenae]
MSNVTAAAASAQDELIPSRSFTDVLEIVIYSVCLGIGGPLNVASFFKLLRFYTHSQRNHTQITLLRLNLNVADLLTMFVYTLSQIIWMITYEWYGGDLLCRLCKFFHTFGFYLNSFVIACIAIDRVYSAYSLRLALRAASGYLLRVMFSAFKSSGRSNTRCRVMLSFAWVFAFALSLPQIFIFRVIELPGMGSFKQCSPIWTIIGYEIDLKLGAPNQTAEHRSLLIEQYHQVVKWERLYNFAHLLFVFWIPALTIVASGPPIQRSDSAEGWSSIGWNSNSVGQEELVGPRKQFEEHTVGEQLH